MEAAELGFGVNLQRGLCHNQIKLDSENKSNYCSKSTVRCHLCTEVQHEAAEQVTAGAALGAAA